jgi:Flp pilus assembly protein CpaB
VSSRRTVILLVAIVVGAVAAFLLFNYVQGIEDDVYEGATRVTAFQAEDLIERGTPGADALNSGAISEQQIPQEFVPSTAITTTEQILSDVALFQIAPGTIIIEGMFVDPTSASFTFRNRLKNRNHTAITIQVDPTRAVGGWLVAGDEINMYVMEDRSESAPAEGEAAPEGEGTGTGSPGVLRKSARMLYQEVQVLSVGQDVLLEPGESAATDAVEDGSFSNMITLNVPPKAAQWIASFDSDFYLTLVPEDYEPKAVEPLPDVIEALPGEDPALLSPYCGPDGEADQPTPCPPVGDGEG